MSIEPSLIADRLLADFETIRPQLSVDVIIELRKRVEDLKFNDPARTLHIAETAVVAAAALADPQAVALAAWSKGTALLFAGRVTDALPCYRQAERLYGELGLAVEQVSVQAPLVYALNAVGETTDALQLAATVQTRCETLGTPARLAMAHLQMNIGTIRKQQGAFADSLIACDRAKTLFSEIGDSEAAARAEMNRANVLQEMDRFTEAADAYATARPPLLASQRNRQQVALIDFNLGLLAERRGRFVEALRYLEAAHDEFTPEIYKAATNLNRALIYNQLNLPTEALQLAESAQVTFAENEMVMDEAHALLVGGIAAHKLGQIERATEQLTQAITSFEQRQAAFWSATARLALIACALPTRVADGKRPSSPTTLSHPLDPALAATVQAEADAANWPTVAVDARLLRVRFALEKSSSGAPNKAESALPPSRAIELLQEAIAIAGAYHLTLHQFESYWLLGRYHQQRGANHKAWEAYQHAILMLETVRATLQIDELQLGYLTDKSALYMDAATLFFNTDNPEQAHAKLLYLLNLAALAPLPVNATNQSANMDPRTEALWNELRRLQELHHWQQRKVTEPMAPLDGPRTTLAKLESQIADCWRRIHVRQQSAGANTNQSVQVTEVTTPEHAALPLYHAIQQALAPTEALVVYIKQDDNLAALIIRSRASTFIRLGSWTTLEKTLHAWRFHINDHQLIQQNPTLALPIAQRLLVAFHKALITPLTAALDNCSELALVLPPALHDLPFAAFWENGYLLDRYQIRYLTAPAALLTARVTTAAVRNTKALVVGHTHGDQLPHAAREAVAITALLQQQGNADCLIGEVATTDHFLEAAPHATLIHIAAHAHFSPSGPLFSAIHLTDRELSLLELYHGTALNKHPLVVLSTCVSGEGTVRGGGLLGLARAFFAAGAGELIVTAWQIDDHATANLMHDFYHHWLVDQSTINTAQALHHAQRHAARTLHPFFWAGCMFIRG